MNAINLQDQLQRNYLVHSKFRFPVSAWQLDTSTLLAFNSAYEVLSRFQTSLSKVQVAASTTLCVRMLTEVFEALRKQASDPHELSFVEELHGECRRLLYEELGHYDASRALRFVTFRVPEAQENALRLVKDRHYFGALPERAVDEILNVCASDVRRLRDHAASGCLSREDLSVSSGPSIRRVVRILNREYKRLGVLDAVSAYARNKVTVTGLALELSVHQADWWTNSLEGMDRPPKTLYAHLDESISLPKSIVYLSEVNESNGPTSCYWHAYEQLALNPLQSLVGRTVGNVGGSAASPLHDYYSRQYHRPMSSERFREHFMRLPTSIRFNSHLGWDVEPDSELEKSLVSCERSMIGQSGTFIIFDGARLLHRGGMVQSGERIALQVIFSAETLAARAFRKVKRVVQ